MGIGVISTMKIDLFKKIAIRSTRIAIVLYALTKQIFFIFFVESAYLLPRSMGNAVMLTLVFTITSSKKTTKQQMSWLVPISAALTEVLTTAATDGDRLILFFLIGCSLLSLLFLDARGLAATICFSSALTGLCIFVLGYPLMGPDYSFDSVIFYFAGMVIINFVIFLFGRYTIGTLMKYQHEAEKANALKTQFLAHMSHEIRTPMNAIIGMTTIAESADDIERKNNALSKIKDASTHLLSVINDILDISKIEAGKFELSSAEFDFESTLRRVVTVIQFRAEEKRQKLAVNIDGSIPVYLTGDDHRLAQVITNLIGNAIKFTPDEGSISVNTLLLSNLDGICEIQIEVTDTGIGISPEKQINLFEPFVQAESSTTRSFGGTGLGLAVSKSIVEMMGGKIWVESALGKGSTFGFTVKLIAGVADAISESSHSQRKAEEEAGKLAMETFPGRHILLAEDVEINREIVLALLEPTLLSIDCAENGAAAVRLFEDSPEKYDMIFMDIQMPEMDGLDATKAIRSSKAPNAVTIPIVAMTANVFREDIEQCLAAGMDDHVGKPLDMDDVMGILRKYLQAVSD